MGIKDKMTKRHITAGFFTCLFISLFFSSQILAGHEAEVRYSKNFTIEKQGEISIVTVRNPWRGSTASFRYLLKPRGHSTPPGFADCQVVEVPVQRSIVLSTTFLAIMDQLGTVDTMVGFGDLDRVHTKSVLKAAKADRIIEVGDGSNLQVETVLDLQPEIIFTFAGGGFRDVHPKLLEAGLQVAVCAEYMETHPLGRSEWIKFFALFFGKEKEAEKIFSDLEQRYLGLTALTRNVKDRPSVVTNTPFQGRWYASGGQSYVGKFLADAGADFIWGHTSHIGSIPMDIEFVYDRGRDAQVWLNTGTWKSLAEAHQADPRLADFASLKAGRLYNNNKRINKGGGNDFWESGMMAPDVILADLIRILHPELLPDHELYYYQHLK